MIKRIIISIFALIIFATATWFLVRQDQNQEPAEQAVLERTMSVSRQYLALSYRTDNLLLSAKSWGSYQAWTTEMSSVIQDWNQLEKDAFDLEGLAQQLAAGDNQVSFQLLPAAQAYDKQEVTDVFDKAPAGKKIATLAKHLGVDAKRASLILQQAQNELTADAWNEAGDTFQKLETTAVVIKDGAKVAGFVGGIAVAGGVSAIAAGGTLAKAAVVVSGADLVLEVSDDASKIALGNHNKLSAIISDGRKVTEPLASILNITDVSNNVKTGYEKFNAVMVALDQFNSAAQDGKVVGVQLPVYKPGKTKAVIEVAVVEPAELQDWLDENNVGQTVDEQEDLKDLLGLAKSAKEGDTSNDAEAVFAGDISSNSSTSSESSAEPAGQASNQAMVGEWRGQLVHTEGSNLSGAQEYVLQIRADGTVSGGGEKTYVWELTGSSLKLYDPEDRGSGYQEFALSGNTLTFVKMAGPDEDGEWAEILAGEWAEISLQKR
jgi:hypothetical protein